MLCTPAGHPLPRTSCVLTACALSRPWHTCWPSQPTPSSGSVAGAQLSNAMLKDIANGCLPALGTHLRDLWPGGIKWV